MANQSSSCFLCSEQISGNQSTKFTTNYVESSFFLNYILELPHWENKVERIKFQEAKYCSKCSEKIGKIRDVLEELDILEKHVLQQKYEIEHQLKESWKKSQQRNRTYNGRRFQPQPRNPMDKLRDEIVNELKSSSAVSMLSKLKENQVGRKYRPRENTTFSQITSNSSPGTEFLVSEANENNKRVRLDSADVSDPLKSISTKCLPSEISVRINQNQETSITTNFVEDHEEIILQDGVDVIIKEEPTIVPVFPVSYPSTFSSTSRETEFSQTEYDPLTTDGYQQQHQSNLDLATTNSSAITPGGFNEHDFYIIEGNQMFSQSPNFPEQVEEENQISIPCSSGGVTITETNLVVPTISEPLPTLCLTRQRQNSSQETNRKFVCGTCGATFSRYSMLKTHDKIHIGETLTRSKTRASTSTSNSGLTIQRYRQIVKPTTSNDSSIGNTKKIRVEPVQFEKRGGKPSTASSTCEECGRTFANKQTKRNHVMTIHRRQTRIQCPLCNYGCQLIGNLRIHMTHCHSDERNFKCSLCPATYKQKWQLLCHTRRHTGERPYQCNLCYARFFDSTALRKHEANNHSSSEPEVVNLEDI